ncbi:MAG: IPT/TIG domain-containing protein [Proteobacteria bacterium]|nr:IPT/TIG domain-containing protein [Pseudomonadota bacterium]
MPLYFACRRPRLVVCGGLLLGLAVVACAPAATRIERADPPFGSVGGNDDVLLTGSGFAGSVSVQFHKRSAKTVIVESSERIRVKTPPGPEGRVDVVLTDEAGRTVVLRSGFTYRKEL